MQDLYTTVPWKYMDWSHRLDGILHEIKLVDPDVLCLQEVDAFDEMERALAALGYKGSFLSRRGLPEGCATFWKSSKFHQATGGEHHIDFANHDLKQNVALIHVLQSKEANWRLLLGNIHVLFNPKRGDIKLAQVRVLLGKVAALQQKHRTASVVICGDFNSAPGSPLYEYVLRGELDCLAHDRRYISGQVEGLAHGVEHKPVRNQFHLPPQEQEQEEEKTPPKNSKRKGNPNKWSSENLRIALGMLPQGTTKITHSLKLHSAYDTVGGEPGTILFSKWIPLFYFLKHSTFLHIFFSAYTSAHRRFVGTVDYIWYAQSEGASIRPLSCLLPLKYESLMNSSVPCLPNRHWPSDHMSIVSDFLVC